MSRQITLLLIALCLLVSLCSCRGSSTGIDFDQEPVTLGLPKTWSTASGDVTQSGYFDWEGPDALDVRWKTAMPPRLIPLQAAADGTLYCYSDYGLAALDTSGEIVWHYNGGHPVDKRLIVSDDGRLHYFGYDSTLHTVNPDGSSAGAREIDFHPLYSYLDSMGRVYYITGDDSNNSDDNYVNYILIAMDDQGLERWRYNPEAGINLKVYLQHDRFYLQEGYTRLAALDLDGNQLWEREDPESRIAHAFATVDGYCIIQWLSNALTQLEIVDPQGNTLLSEYADLMENGAFGDYSGPDNEMYLQIEDTVWRYDIDAGMSELSTGVDELVGVSPDGYVLVNLEESASSNTFEMFGPGGDSLGTVDLNWFARNCVIGYGGSFYLGDTSFRFSAFACQPNTALQWDYRCTYSQPVITVRENGDASIVGWNGVRSFMENSGGEMVTRDLAFGSDQPSNWTYRGYLEDAACHLLIHGTDCLAVNNEGGLVWEQTCAESITKALPGRDRVWLITESTCMVLDTQGNLLATVENPNEELFTDLAAGYDGRFYLCDRSGHLLEAGPDGTISWDLALVDGGLTDLVVAGDDLLLVQNRATLYGVSRNGTPRWDYAVDSGYIDKPAYSPKGVIYLPQYDYSNIGIPAAGEYQEIKDQLDGTESAESYLNASESLIRHLILLTTKGELIKTVEAAYMTRNQPLVDSRGVAYCLDYGQGLTAVEPSGQIAWRFDFTDYIRDSTHSFRFAPSPTGGFILANHDYVVSIGE